MLVPLTLLLKRSFTVLLDIMSVKDVLGIIPMDIISEEILIKTK